MLRFLESKKFIPILFGIVTFLAYGLLVPFTGFYWDDWIFVWIAKFLGPSEFIPAFLGIRPFLIPIFLATTSLIPPIPIYWQIFALVVHCAAGLSAWFVLSRVWPQFKLQILAASLLFLVFPAYSQHWVAYTHINQEWIAFILYLLSIGLTATALRRPEKFKFYTLLAILLYFEGLFATEYFFGLEPLRFLFIWVMTAESIQNPKESFFKALKVWSPYLLIWLVNAAWLGYYYSLGYNAYDLEVLHEAPSIFNFLPVMGEVIWKVGLYAWVQVLALTAPSLTAPSTLLTYALVCVVFVLLFPVFNKVRSSQTPARMDYLKLTLIGLIGILLGRLPSFAAGLPLRLQSSFDRFTISMMLGGCLFIVGLVGWIIKNDRARTTVYILLIALGVGQQFFNGNIFRRDWEAQQEFFWQLKWRMPALEPGTVLLAADEITIDYESNIALAGPLNWMYTPEHDYKQNDLPYLLIDVRNRLGGTLPSIEPNTEFHFALRQMEFNGNTSRAIVIYKPRNGCLRVLDPAFGDSKTYEKILPRTLAAIPLSDTSRILTTEIQSPEFLSAPKTTWCYYYTKAELARQFKDWNRILSLQAAAAADGYLPSDPLEWLPFIEANAMTEHWEQAAQLARTAIKQNVRTSRGVCQVWERVQAQSEAGSAAANQISQLRDEFQCAP